MTEPGRPAVSTGEAGMFLLEIVGLVGIARLGWHLGSGTLMKATCAVLFVLAASAFWTLFRARGFVPSGGDPAVAVPGPVRLVIEYGFYALGTIGLWISGWEIAAAVFATAVLVISFALRERLGRLLASRPRHT